MKTLKKRFLSLLLTIVMVFGVLPMSAFAADPEGEEDYSKTVYFSFSHDDQFVKGENSETPMAMQKITVPYFDLGIYGLSDFYFSSEEYTDDGDGLPGSDLQPGTAEFAYGKVTLLHLFIYATEVYYCGIAPEEAGKGYLASNGLGTGIFEVSGSVGSALINQIWGYDMNLNYYRNHEYPLASEGWGSTADQILLRDGDVYTMAHFSSWSFYSDTHCIFHHIEDGENTASTSIKKGDKHTMTVYIDGPNVNGDSGTAHTVVDCCPDIYYIAEKDMTSGDVTTWNYLTTADENGQFVVDTANMAPGNYILAMAGEHGQVIPDDICSTPAAIRLTVEEPDYYADYPFVNITADDSEQSLIDITEEKKSISMYGSPMGEFPTYQVIVPDGTENVHVTFPEGAAFVNYVYCYVLSTNELDFDDYSTQVTVANNADGTVTVTIPASKFTDADKGILLENDSYTPVYGFDFVAGTPTVPGGSDEDAVAATGVTLDKSTVTVDLKDKDKPITLTATVQPEDATNKGISWTSSNEEVATVSGKGEVTIKDAGTTTITAKTRDGGFTAQCVINVVEANRPEQDTEGTYLITTAEEMKWYADKVNSGKNTINAKLMNDIDLSAVCGEEIGSWDPIGAGYQTEEQVRYRGNFDGQGYTISNFYMDNTSDDVHWQSGNFEDRGFFGRCTGNTIKNLNLQGTIYTKTRFVGGLIGALGDYTNGSATVENCHVDVDIITQGDNWAVGGVVGLIRNDSQVINCSYSGTITGSGKTQTGGIVGIANYTKTTKNVISGCVFNGELKTPGDPDTYYDGVGGIVGKIQDTTEVKDCISVGKITSTGKMSVGGVIGAIFDVAIVNNCYAASEISCENAKSRGGVVGKVDNAQITMKNAFYLNTTAASDPTAGVAKTAEELKAAASLLGENFKESVKLNKGYPALLWQNEPTEPEKPENPFDDVTDENKFYYDAVLWAVDNGITTGTTPTTFSPDNGCTRAQFAMLLWKAAGEPDHSITSSPFRDLGENSRFYDAVMWAYENDIIKGYRGGTLFGPGDVIKRGECVAMLYRAAENKSVTIVESPFADVTEEKYPSFAKAIMWAAENGIALGRNGNFMPTKECSRGEVVTFLYRANHLENE